jgi:hypothetical protein
MGTSNHRPHSKRAAKSAPKVRHKNEPPELHPAGRRSDEGKAFLPDPYDGSGAPARAGDPLAESLAEEFVVSATTAEEVTEDDRDQLRTEEVGGPFTETTGAEEFATEPDESNPVDADKEPFPTATRQPT